MNKRLNLMLHRNKNIKRNNDPFLDVIFVHSCKIRIRCSFERKMIYLHQENWNSHCFLATLNKQKYYHEENLSIIISNLAVFIWL